MQKMRGNNMDTKDVSSTSGKCWNCGKVDDLHSSTKYLDLEPVCLDCYFSNTIPNLIEKRKRMLGENMKGQVEKK
jgi:hypothetical protein